MQIGGGQHLHPRSKEANCNMWLSVKINDKICSPYSSLIKSCELLSWPDLNRKSESNY
jgi:hypothetical protein